MKEKPATPKRILIGQDHEDACRAPGSFWICPSRPSERQLEGYERTLRSVNSNDVCSRGQIIMHYPPSWDDHKAESRIDHLVWMIDRHPEWDGFTVNPYRGPANPRSERERREVYRLNEAWLKQVGSEQRNSIVLHNAALFFAHRERAFAVALMKRAISLNPNEPVYTERLGLLYSISLMARECFEQGDSPTSASYKALVREAQDALRHSQDWILLAGALSATKVGCLPDTPDLYRKLEEIRPGVKPWAIVDSLPSRSSSWCRSTCVPAERDRGGR